MYGITASRALALATGFVLVSTMLHAQTVNFRTDKLSCHFVHHCFPGKQLKMRNGVVDYSACAKVNERVTWDPATSTYVVRGAARQVVSTRLKRRSATVRGLVGQQFYTLAASANASSMRVSALTSPDGVVTDFYGGTCKVMN